MRKIKKGDEVIVIAGKKENKGQRGIVLKVHKDLVLVEGINQVTKHVKPNPQKEEEGGIIKKEAYLHISNVMLFNKESGKGEKVGFKFENGKKVRFFRTSGTLVD